MSNRQQLSQEDYENLLAFRTALRHFLRWSQSKAGAVGLTPAQYQLLLAVKGHRGASGPTVGDLAGYLMLRPHSTVELIDRAEDAGLVDRWGDEGDRRIIRIRLTTAGERRLEQLVPAHIDELHQLAPILDHVVAHAASATSPARSRARPALGIGKRRQAHRDGPARVSPEPS